jgi:hypothetical protein
VSGLAVVVTDMLAVRLDHDFKEKSTKVFKMHTRHVVIIPRMDSLVFESVSGDLLHTSGQWGRSTDRAAFPPSDRFKATLPLQGSSSQVPLERNKSAFL